MKIAPEHCRLEKLPDQGSVNALTMIAMFTQSETHLSFPEQSDEGILTAICNVGRGLLPIADVGGQWSKSDVRIVLIDAVVNLDAKIMGITA